MSIQTPHVEFPSTHWSVVRSAADLDEAGRRAVCELLKHYSPALKWHLVRYKGLDAHDADDVLQAFLVEKVLVQNLFSHADKGRGRFRSFLVTTLDRFLSNHRRAENAQKRAPRHKVPLDGMVEDTFAGRRLADTFEVAWAREVLAEAVRSMREHCLAIGRTDIWRVFEARILHPALRQVPPVPYTELVAELHFESPAQASNALVTAQRSFGRALRAVIGRYELEPEQIEEEMTDLRRILATGSAGSSDEAGIVS